VRGGGVGAWGEAALSRCEARRDSDGTRNGTAAHSLYQWPLVIRYKWHKIAVIAPRSSARKIVSRCPVRAAVNRERRESNDQKTLALHLLSVMRGRFYKCTS
jgi:hypothetical protein